MIRLPRFSWKTLLFALLIAAAAWLRLYNLPNSLQFQGDEGRDALIVSRIFTQGDLVFIGPVTSVGNMYLGPLYYYFMVPWLWLTYPSPLGPVYAVAVLGIITVILMYVLGRELIGERPALIATAFYSFCAVVIQYTRFSWNPNPAPLVSLIMIWCTYRAWKRNPWYWAGVALCFSILIQLHYLTLLSAAGAGLIWLWGIWEQRSDAKKLRKLALITGLSALIVLVSFTPLILFDFKHNWLNLKALQSLFTKEDSFKLSSKLAWYQKIAATVKEMHGRSLHILFEYALGKQRWLDTALVTLFLGVLAWVWSRRQRPHHAGELVIGAYLVTGIAGTALYQHTVFNHYIAYLFPVTFLVYGIVLNHLSRIRIGQLFGIGLFLAFLAYNLPRLPHQSAGWTITDMARTSHTIYERVRPGEQYNIVLLSETGDIDGMNYRYFLSTTDRPPVDIQQRDQVQTLFIINEDRKLAKVTDSPVYEIVVFPNKTPAEVYTVSGGPEITVLRRETQ